MGRPLNKKYFGNRNTGVASPTDDGLGGEGVASVTIGGSWAGFTDASTTVTFSAPQLPSGTTATGTATIVGGAVTAVVITNKGSGYTSAPTVTIVDSDGGAETTGTATAVLTNTQEQSLYVYAQTTSGGSRKLADIISQKGSTKFRVKTADGTATCILRTDGLSGEGTMDITATDSAGGGYWVQRISNHNCVLVQKGSGGGTQFANGTKVQWTLGSAVQDVSVTIANA